MSRRAALLGRFRVMGLDRLRRADLALLAQVDQLADGGPEQPQGRDGPMDAVARELHTLKGEARLLGQGELAELIHDAETRLQAARTPGAAPLSYDAVRQALGVAEATLRGSASQKEGEGILATLAPLRPVVRAAVTFAEPERPAGEPEPSVPVPTAPAVPSRPVCWVSVDAARIDEVCERLAGFQSELRLLAARLREATAGDLRPIIEGAERGMAHLDELCAAAWTLRLVPVGPVLEDLSRHARNLAEGLGKRVRGVVRGGEAQIERAVLDQIREPLVHLVRNAIDHGLEAPAERGDKGPEGRLLLLAEAIGPNLHITVEDDGRGIDARAIRRAAVDRGVVSAEAAARLPDDEAAELLFLHGFSTQSQVSDLSGRGVGLDVVRRIVEGMGGQVTLTSELHRGSRFLLRVPVRIGTERVVVFPCGEGLYAVPARSVLEVLRLSEHSIEAVVGGQRLRCRGEALPLRSMSQTLFGEAGDDEVLGLLVNHGGRRYCFAIPKLCGEHELLRHPPGALLAHLEYLSASAVLDDGRLVLVLTVAGLLRRSESRRPLCRAPRPTSVAPRVLIVDDSAIVRDLLSQVLRAGGLLVQEAAEAGAALRILGEGEPDAVLLDVDMPGMNGFDLLARIRSRNQHLPVIMFTTRPSVEDQQRAAALGADAYLIKSQFQEATLLDTVRRYASAPQGEQVSEAPLLRLERWIGLDLTRGGQGAAIERLVVERARALGFSSVDAYLGQLSDPTSPEAQRLIGAATVPHTWFFRDRAQLEHIGQLLRLRPDGAPPAQIWVAGCATGEDAYSVSLLAEGVGRAVEIVGSDLSARALAVASRGRYPSAALRAIPEELRAHVLSAPAGQVEIGGPLRRRVRFQLHNLVEEPLSSASGWDLILCRNVLIYFDSARARVVIQRLAAQLSRTGLLFLGASEVIQAPPAGLQIVGLGDRFALKRAQAALAEAPAKRSEARPLLAPAAADRELGAAKACLEQGVARYLANEIDLAVPALGEARRLWPSLWTAAFYLGLCYERLGRDADALREFQRALDGGGDEGGIPEELQPFRGEMRALCRSRIHAAHGQRAKAAYIEDRNQ